MGYSTIISETRKKYPRNWKRHLSYIPVLHDVLDKYEFSDGVINQDVVDFQPSEHYDLIFSIVTMQHVGCNEYPRNPKKILKAFDNLKALLNVGGLIIILHGLGENKEMDEFLKNGTLEFNKRFYLMKTSKYKWKQVSWEDVKDLSYDYSIPSAKGIVIGIFEKISIN